MSILNFNRSQFRVGNIRGSTSLVERGVLDPDGNFFAVRYSLDTSGYDIFDSDINCDVGDEYTIKFFARRNSGAGNLRIHIYFAGSNRRPLSDPFVLSANWQEYTFTITPQAGDNAFNQFLTVLRSDTGTVEADIHYLRIFKTADGEEDKKLDSQTFYTDFSEETVGQSPANWTKRDQNTNVLDLDIIADGTREGGKYFEIVSGIGRHGPTYNPINNQQNIVHGRIKSVVRVPSGGFANAFYDSSGDTVFYFGFQDDVIKVSDEINSRTVDGTLSLDSATWYETEFIFWHDAILYRIWEEGTTAPSFSTHYTERSFDVSFLGFTAFGENDSLELDTYQFESGTPWLNINIASGPVTFEGAARPNAPASILRFADLTQASFEHVEDVLADGNGDIIGTIDRDPTKHYMFVARDLSADYTGTIAGVSGTGNVEIDTGLDLSALNIGTNHYAFRATSGSNAGDEVTVLSRSGNTITLRSNPGFQVGDTFIFGRVIKGTSDILLAD